MIEKEKFGGIALKHVGRYNDYVRMTKQRLSEYNNFLVYVENARKELKVKEKSLGSALDCSTPIAEEIDIIKRNVSEVQLQIDNIRRALDSLDHDSRQVIHEYYIGKKSWEQIAQDMHYSTKWVREKRRKALQDIAIMLFGARAKPKQLSFVFAP